jgi:glycosyltransferase involved in cell wall biosynthesis
VRIGVFLGKFDPIIGGGYTFQSSIVDAIKTFQNSHEFIILHYGQNIVPNHSSVKVVNLNRLYSKKNRIHRCEIEIVEKRIYLQKISKIFNKIISFFLKCFKSFTSVHGLKDKSSHLQQAVNDYRIEIVWFLTPSYQKINVPFLYTVWDLQHRVQPFFPEVSVTGWDWDHREKHYSEILPRSMKVLTGTNVGKEEIIHFYRVYRDNVEVVPFPTPMFYCLEKKCNVEDLDLKYHFNRDYLIYPAQFWPHKNHIGILHALELLINYYSIKMDLVLVGSDKGNEAYVREKAFELGVNDYVHFLGFVPENDLIYLYQRAFALIFPTFFGPDNLPPLEAFALGCPVIASNVPGSKEQLKDAALFFEPRSKEDMAIKIKTLFDDPHLRQNLISKGIERAKERSPYDYIKDIIHIIDDFEAIKRCWKTGYIEKNIYQ